MHRRHLILLLVAEFRANVQRVEAVDTLTVRFHLKEPWPDFMTFYGTTATAASRVVPKKYFEQVGEDGFKKHPIGLGPYKFVSFKPGVELVLEAFEGYWRKVPHVKRLVMKGVPEGATRLAGLTGVGARVVEHTINAIPCTPARPWRTSGSRGNNFSLTATGILS
jgi:ABC-type transport system substrate-binding protein